MALVKQRYQRSRRRRPLERPSVHGVRIRSATSDDAAAIAEIYNQGIEDRMATFETRRRSAQDQRAWLQSITGRYPAVVAEIASEIVGWAGAGPYRDRECYRGIGEFSMYVHRDWRRRGLGDLLLADLISEAERLGLWKLLSRIFLSTRPVARSVANTDFVRLACMRNMRASMAAGLTL